ncbi:MAG TPA: hypothetical protein VJQ55_14580 [Candidatus Binatia bacterium]|nr:hypothetical protein [Candidatus Binatia bacterium]
MKRIVEWFVATCWPFGAAEKILPEPPVTRISVLASGKILLDGKEVGLASVKGALQRIKVRKGAVWYYRESGKGEPPQEAVEVFKLIVENKLPVSLSTKGDFSDYVDEDGQSQPRK